MRIVVALNTYEETGAARLVFRLVQRWSPDSRVEIATVAVSRGGPMAARYRDLGVGTEVIGARGPMGWSRMRDWARRVASSGDRPHLVHSHHLMPDLCFRTVANELGDIPLVETHHGFGSLEDKGWLTRTGALMLERATRGRVAAWVAPSRFLCQRMLEDGVPTERLHRIPNGVDGVQTFPLSDHHRSANRACLAVPESGVLIGCVGSLTHSRGQDVLIDALPAIVARHPAARVVFFGDGPERERLLLQAGGLGVRDHVSIIGPLSTLLPSMLSTLDVFVHPCRQDAFGLVVAEAEACGTPVVASRVGGIPEILRDGETGILVPAGDSRSLADAVSRLLADADLRRRMGEAGREFILSEFELGHTAEAYIELWRSLVGWETGRLRIEPADAEAP